VLCFFDRLRVGDEGGRKKKFATVAIADWKRKRGSEDRSGQNKYKENKVEISE
jgi:hypothetical protein